MVQRLQLGKTPLPLVPLLTGRFEPFLCLADGLGLGGESLLGELQVCSNA
jgi:hypothetical protein